uniref:Uncharacterized protein n=1 Tax=Steinernema glaseri TaxID=37863 RepID=A0A1I8AII2_9BILA
MGRTLEDCGISAVRTARSHPVAKTASCATVHLSTALLDVILDCSKMSLKTLIQDDVTYWLKDIPRAFLVP